MKTFVVTAANDNMGYKALAHKCIQSASRKGYPVMVYDLGGLGTGNTKF